MRGVRFDLKIMIEPSKTAVVTLLETLTNFLEKHFEANPGSEIQGWHALDMCKPIVSIDGIPKNMTLLKNTSRMSLLDQEEILSLDMFLSA